MTHTFTGIQPQSHRGKPLENLLKKGIKKGGLTHEMTHDIGSHFVDEMSVFTGIEPEFEVQNSNHFFPVFHTQQKLPLTATRIMAHMMATACSLNNSFTVKTVIL